MAVLLRSVRKPQAASAPAQPGYVHALPAVIAPPVAMLAPPVAFRQPEQLPAIEAPPLPASFEDSRESTESWLRRNLSFAVSLVVHLLLLIALALWIVTEPERTQIAILSEPPEPVMEEVIQITPPAEDVPDLNEILSAAGGNMTDLPDAPEVSQIADIQAELDETIGFDFAPQVTDQLLMPLGGGSEGGGGRGGRGAGEEIGDLMQFVERLQRAGAKSGDVQISLIWDNYNDLDLHVITPRGENIFFGKRRSRCRGELDVDMNAGQGTTREPVENVYWGKGKAPYGKFRVAVHHFRNHGDDDPTAYELRVVVDGTTKVIQGEISYGSPRMIVYEFDRTGSDAPAKSVTATQNAGFRIINARD
jgi:hypothetical protein